MRPLHGVSSQSDTEGMEAHWLNVGLYPEQLTDEELIGNSGDGITTLFYTPCDKLKLQHRFRLRDKSFNRPAPAPRLLLDPTRWANRYTLTLTSANPTQLQSGLWRRCVMLSQSGVQPAPVHAGDTKMIICPRVTGRLDVSMSCTWRRWYLCSCTNSVLTEQRHLPTENHLDPHALHFLPHETGWFIPKIV